MSEQGTGGQVATVGRRSLAVDARGLTAMQAAFVLAYVRDSGGNGAEAARRAGYADPAATAYGLLRLPHVSDAIRTEQRAYLGGELTTLALSALRAALMDPEAKHTTKIAAAKIVLDRAGFGPTKPDENGEEDGKSLDELSIHELERIIANKLAALKPVQPAPAIAPDEPETPGQSGEGTA